MNAPEANDMFPLADKDDDTILSMFYQKESMTELELEIAHRLERALERVGDLEETQAA